jgi:undecaprenyl diphosphate synthase
MTKSSLHAAIIMDGNGRWAESRALPRAFGHRAGAEALRTVVEAAPGCGIGTLTAYAFSSDNWKRPSDEVNALMGLFAWYLESETPRLAANSVRVSVIGRRDRLPLPLLAAIQTAEEVTRKGTGLHLQLAVDYSARDAILRATRESAVGATTIEEFERCLGPGRPVDLLIRTAGEQRLSDFLLWECAYAELVFTRCLWPDFNEAALRNAVTEFRRRERRFGALPAHPEQSPDPAVPSRDARWLR